MELGNHLRDIETSIQDLVDLSPTLGAPASLQMQYVGTCVANTVTLLCAVANSVDGGTRHVNFSDERNWHSAMKAVHRSFYSSIVSCTEKACADLCIEKNIKPTVKRLSSVDSTMQLIEQNSDMPADIRKRIETKLRALVGESPAFSDYLEAVIQESNLQYERAEMWRKYFRALSIVRNKASHSDVALSSIEIADLKAGGLGVLVSNRSELQLNSMYYRQICDHIALFFKEL
jgi:hypothetical protein